MRSRVLVFVVALLVSACGGEELSEQILEESIGGDANVEISEDGDEVSINIESDEGSISIGGGEVPEEITIPLPDGGVVNGSFVAGGNASVSLEFANDRYDEIVGFYESWTSGSGETWLTSEQTSSVGELTTRSHSWQSDETVRTIFVRDCYSISGSFEGPFDAVCVDINDGSGS